MADLLASLQAAAGATGETDENFNQTVLLLHGDGTDGAQNNTFLDSSSNGFSITRVGNTTQGTFSPFSAPDGRWSNYFDGTGDYLAAPDNAAFDFGTPSGTTNDFTLEAWIYPVAFNTAAGIMGSYNDVSQTGYRFVLDNNGSLRVNIGGVASFNLTSASATVLLNQWQHIAVTRTSNNVYIYHNGTRVASGTTSNAADAPSIFLIGRNAVDVNNWYFAGYISNARALKGTAQYTASTYTVPTSPLTAVSGTSLLTCQSNRFVDNSTNNFAITRNGDVKVTPFSPFAPTAAYDASVNGGSGYFDGTGDYLETNASATLSGDFTIDCWINHFDNGITTDPAQRVFSSTNAGANNANNLQILVGNNTSGIVVDGGVFIYSDTFLSSAASASITGTGWHHVAVSRSGTNLRIFLDGVQIGTTTTNSTSFSVSNSYIGTRDSGTSNSNFSGYISNFRLINGTALYTSAFTPPTAPQTAITNTELLCNFTNAGIFDNTGKNNLETVGNAQIDTTTKKYGTGSMEFDGTGDVLLCPDSENLELGSGNFTIEGWFNFSSFVSGTGYFLVTKAIATFASDSSFAFWLNTSNKLRFIFSNSGGSTNYVIIDTTNTFTPTTGVWYHIAITREGSTFRIFIDGASQAITTTTTGTGSLSDAIPNSTRPLAIGASSDIDYEFNGFIDDLRITKGVARYTTTFTPPTKAFPNL